MPVRVGLQYIDIWNTSLEKSVLAYEAQNDPQGQIVFYGPSYFTRWSERWGNTPLEEALLGKSGARCCINRGFGSSCPEHQLYYYPRMVRSLAPRVLVYGSWGNSEAFGYSDDEALELAERVIAYARTDFPDMPIYLMGAHYIRKALHPLTVREVYNDKLRKIAQRFPNCHFFNPLEYKPLCDPDIFVEDGVHYNQRGFELFADYFREILKDELAKF
ncbi:MAG: hypothetical protein E7650_04530 [Ruminococcaceae bacterium]|nr:hypothetical protein [Oscillospiraceae bacterium]